MARSLMPLLVSSAGGGTEGTAAPPIGPGAGKWILNYTGLWKIYPLLTVSYYDSLYSVEYESGHHFSSKPRFFF